MLVFVCIGIYGNLCEIFTPCFIQVSSETRLATSVGLFNLIKILNKINK